MLIADGLVVCTCNFNSTVDVLELPSSNDFTGKNGCFECFLMRLNLFGSYLAVLASCFGTFERLLFSSTSVLEDDSLDIICTSISLGLSCLLPWWWWSGNVFIIKWLLYYYAWCYQSKLAGDYEMLLFFTRGKSFPY